MLFKVGYHGPGATRNLSSSQVRKVTSSCTLLCIIFNFCMQRCIFSYVLIIFHSSFLGSTLTTWDYNWLFLQIMNITKEIISFENHSSQLWFLWDEPARLFKLDLRGCCPHANTLFWKQAGGSHRIDDGFGKFNLKIRKI